MLPKGTLTVRERCEEVGRDKVEKSLENIL